jgi:hypothetical protein
MESKPIDPINYNVKLPKFGHRLTFIKCLLFLQYNLLFLQINIFL